uniref:Midasin n=1 Tax=Gongylonema pulchrum TaxID=637853 RepID=A0A183DX30_9BILA
LLKDCDEQGLCSRRSLTIDSEQLTAKIVGGIAVSDKLSAKLIRQGGALRNIVLKKFHQPNAQLSTRTVNVLKGLIEFILNELHTHHQTYFVAMELLNKLAAVNEILANYQQNAKASEISSFPDTVLSKLYQQHPEYILFKHSLISIQEAAERVLGVIHSSLVHFSGFQPAAIWKISDISHVLDTIEQENLTVKSELSRLHSVLAEEVEEAREAWRNLETLAEPAPLEEIVRDGKWDEMHFIPLTFQEACKQTEPSQLRHAGFMDALSTLKRILELSRLDKAVESVWNLCVQLSNGWMPPDSLILGAVSQAASAYEVFSYIVDLYDQYIIRLANFYIYFGALSATLLEKGYVNPIPQVQEEQNPKSSNKMQPCDDVAGMGDASGDKDVGEEIEETGQVEGLQGDNNANDDSDEKGTEKPSESTPLEMDDDFAGTLEDVDREEQSDNEGSDEGEENEPNADQEMGAVDQSEEDKLDPELWDNDGDEKELADENEGANKATDKLVANKEEEATGANNEENKATEDNANGDVDMENVDERENLNGDDEGTTEIDNEKGSGNEDEENLGEEEGMEAVMDNNLHENDDEVESVGGSATEVDASQDAEDQQDHEDNVEDIDKNDETVEDLTGDDQPVKGDTGGMDSRAPEDVDGGDDVEIGSGAQAEMENESKDIDKNDETVEELTGDDQPVKGDAGGMDTGAPENVDDGDDVEIGSGTQAEMENESNKSGNLENEIDNKEKKALKGKGKGNEKSNESNECDNKLEREKKLAGDDVAADIAVQQAPPGESGQEDEDSPEFGHADQHSSSIQERIVIDKSSVEEAKKSKEKAKQLENLCIDEKQIDEKMVDEVTMEEEDDEWESLSVDLRESNIHSSVIHTAADFYSLASLFS